MIWVKFMGANLHSTCLFLFASFQEITTDAYRNNSSVTAPGGSFNTVGITVVSCVMAVVVAVTAIVLIIEQRKRANFQRGQ